MELINKILEFKIFNVEDYSLQVYTIVSIVLIILFTKLVLWFVRKGLENKRFSKVSHGSSYALFQIIRYTIWVISIAFIFETIGIKVTVLIAGSAALLVGIGLGLQQTFNDIISGIILLIEGTTKVGDVLEIDKDVVMIKSIGLRTSKGLNRDDIIIIIPNSLITTNKVINWSHQSQKTRFRINVGVAYGSDVDLVIKVLQESALEHPEIHDKNLIEVRFVDFGNSSLDFQVMFYSTNIFRIEKIKSEIRKTINQKFIENHVKIPFPQLDVHLQSKHY